MTAASDMEPESSMRKTVSKVERSEIASSGTGVAEGPGELGAGGAGLYSGGGSFTRVESTPSSQLWGL